MKDLASNLSLVRERIAAAAHRAGRDPDEVTLVAVTKMQSPAMMQAGYDLGLRDFGENRVGEAEDKVGELPADITWHMIGHIQSRKANRIAPLFQIVHSVDRLKLARRLDRVYPEDSPPLPILLEVNVSGEESKHGFPASRWESEPAEREALFGAVEEMLALSQLQIQGLMTMAPIVPNPESARPVFVRLRQLRDELAATFPAADWHHLSMGMTDDFEVAVEEGATLVRIGRAIFPPELPAWRSA